MDTSFYSQEELKSIKNISFGTNCQIGRNVKFYPAQEKEGISIGNNVRIDDFCILCGNISIGSNIHIAPYCTLYGAFGITIMDFCGLSARVTIYSGIDDFSGESAVGPMVSLESRNIKSGRVILKRYNQVGAGSIIFPGVTLHEGCAIGAMSLVKEDLAEWGIYAGIPARLIKERSKNLLLKIK